MGNNANSVSITYFLQLKLMLTSTSNSLQPCKLNFGHFNTTVVKQLQCSHTLPARHHVLQQRKLTISFIFIILCPMQYIVCIYTTFFSLHIKALLLLPALSLTFILLRPLPLFGIFGAFVILLSSLESKLTKGKL